MSLGEAAWKPGVTKMMGAMPCVLSRIKADIMSLRNARQQFTTLSFSYLGIIRRRAGTGRAHYPVGGAWHLVSPESNAQMDHMLRHSA